MISLKFIENECVGFLFENAGVAAMTIRKIFNIKICFWEVL
jgi:hypothetical protein